MNQILGRSYVPPGSNLVLKGLISETIHLLKSTQSSPLDKAVGPLVQALEKIDNICIEHICAFGRKFAEEFTLFLMKQNNLKQSGVLLKNLETLQQSGKLAPWIFSYLHSLRIFGNETIHTRQSIKYVP